METRLATKPSPLKLLRNEYGKGLRLRAAYIRRVEERASRRIVESDLRVLEKHLSRLEERDMTIPAGAHVQDDGPSLLLYLEEADNGVSFELGTYSSFSSFELSWHNFVPESSEAIKRLLSPYVPRHSN